MQDLFIEFLPPWVETGLQPAFYDRESGTVLQQTARMYAKVNELVKAVNGMDKVIKEYVDYIDNYFKNLDVQEEINNKLDEMAEGGELAEFIALYANLPCVHAYATISDMASSENLEDGSYARAMSKTVAGTGDGFYYYIRTKTGADTPDGENLVAVGDDLVAVKIPDYALNALATDIDGRCDDIEDDITSLDGRVDALETAKKHMVVIGDSFSTTTYNPADTAWYSIVAKRLNLTVHNYAKDSAGYVHVGAGGRTFSIEADDAIADASFDNGDVEYVFVYGGLNDMNSTDEGGIRTASASLCDKLIENFPNARIVLVGINAWPGGCWVYGDRTTINFWGEIKANCAKKGVICISSTLWLLTDSNNYYDEVNSHPNEDGNKLFATNLLTTMFGNGGAFASQSQLHANATTGSGSITVGYTTNSIQISGHATTSGGTAVIPIPKHCLGSFQVGATLVGISSDRSVCWINRNIDAFTLHADSSTDKEYYFGWNEPIY